MRVNLRRLGLVVPLIAALTMVSALLAAGSGVALATTGRAGITMTGSCSDFQSDEKFSANSSTTIYITWDSTNLYIGWEGGDTAGNDSRLMGFDLNPGSSDPTQTYDGAVFEANGMPDYLVQVQPSGYKAFNSRQNTGWHVITTAPTTQFNANGCGTNVPMTEVTLPWSSFTGACDTSGCTVGTINYSAGQAVGFIGYSNNSGGSFVYGTMPIGNPTGASPQTLNYEMNCPSTTTGQSPNTYCTAKKYTGATAVAASHITVTHHHGKTVIRWFSSTHPAGFNVYKHAHKLNSRLVTSKTHWYKFVTKVHVKHPRLVAVSLR